MTQAWPARFLLVSLVAALAGCGGGGGGGGAAPAEISAANAPTIARAVIDQGYGAGIFGTAAAGAGGLVTPLAGRGQVAFAAATGRRLIQQVATSATSRPLLAFGPEQISCTVSGTASVSGNLANVETLSPGDRIDFTFANCNDDGSVLNGFLRVTINSFTLDANTGLFALRARVLISDLAITEATFFPTPPAATETGDGTFDLELDLLTPGTTDLTVSGVELSVTSAGQSWVLRDFVINVAETLEGEPFAVTSTTYTATGTLEGSAFEGAVDFVTVVPLRASLFTEPDEGQVLIEGANGATLRVTVLDEVTLLLEADLDGDGDTDNTQQIAWSDIGPLGAEFRRALPLPRPILLPG